MATTDYSAATEQLLPVNIEAERSILGAILLDNFCYTQATLQADDFSLDSHRRIFTRMRELGESGRAIDYVTLSEELSRHKELEAIGGFSYLASLTDGLPRVQNIEHYVKIVKDKSLLRGLIHAANNAIARAIEQSEPAEDILASAEALLFQLSDTRLGNDFRAIPQIVQESFGSIDALYARGRRITGLATHFDKLDEMTSGLQPSDLVIIAARPSMGKTAFAMNIAEEAAVKDKKIICIFSLEMSRESLLLRMLCSNARVDSHRLRTGTLFREDREKLTKALGRLAESKIFIDDTPSISVSEMRAKARRLQHAQGGLDLVIVDYLQLMAATPTGGKRYENRTQEVSAISRGLKMLAKELRVPVVALSQLSRAPESRAGDHRPQLSDLRESGSIEQDADVVAFIFREEVYKSDPDEREEVKGQAEIIIAKQRNGPTGTVRLAFTHKSTRFDNPADDADGPIPANTDFE
ncbi:MAG: replicative DNA helicase [Terriglobales bacterium]